MNITAPAEPIKANSVIEVRNDAKAGASQRFYVAHTSETNGNIGVAAYPINRFTGVEKPKHAHALVRTIEIKERQIIDLTSLTVLVHIPSNEAVLSTSTAPELEAKYTEKTQAAVNESLAHEDSPLVKAYRKTFMPHGESGALGTDRYTDARMTTPYGRHSKGTGMMSTEGKDRIAPDEPEVK